MKKIFNLLFIVLCFTISIDICYAAKAYSVGTKYASGLEHAGNDFRGLVATASNTYGWLAGYTSYYSYDPTYSYINSTSRLGGSSVFFIAGHASPTNISLASRDSADYRTGITAFTSGTVLNDRNNKSFKYAGLQGRNMSSTKLITFAGCKTGYAENSYSVTLVNRAVQQGATAAVGFSNNIGNYSYDTKWLEKYNTLLGNGWSIQYSIEKANIYSPGNCSNYVTTSGNTNISLGTLATANSIIGTRNTSLINKNNMFENINFEEEYINYDVNSDIYVYRDLEDNEEVLSKIVNEIKLHDDKFNLNEYKVDYNFVNDNGDVYIFLTKYINDIKTNKVYFVVAEKNKVTKIWLAGVKKENNVSVDEQNIIDRKKTFETTAKTEFELKNKRVQKNKEKTYYSSDDEYYYDYNTGELTYIINNIYNYGDTGSSVDSIPVTLN